MLREFFSSDHHRLNRLLGEATLKPDCVDLESFERFRAGLLRHIAMEEKVLFPAVRRRLVGEPLPIVRRLHLEHGAIAGLLVPTPTPAVVARLVSILEPHNRAEEQPGGLYDRCDSLLKADAEELLATLRAFPEVRLAPHQDGPLVEKTIEDAIRRARESDRSD